MTRHIGIVACSAEGAALCYRTICLEAGATMGEHDHPEVSMHTHSLGKYMRLIDRDDWHGVGELMLSSAGEARGGRRGAADLSRQHHSPGVAACESARAASMAAHRRSRRR